MAMKYSRWVAAITSSALVATPAFAKSADSLQDLVGAKGAGGETQLEARGFEHVKTEEGSSSKYSYWWHAGRKDCVRVETYDGRYASISNATDSDCGHKSGGGGTAVAAAAIGAAAIGAILLSRKSKKSSKDWQQVQVHDVQKSLRIFRDPDKTSRVRGEVDNGALLKNFGCDTYGGSYDSEVWCEVSTMNNRTKGWARDRYLRPTDGSGSSGGGWGGGYDRPAQFTDLIGARAAGAMSTLGSRGFRQVDNFTSGNARYSIQWRASSRQCLQAIIADGRIENITDIQTHPKCR